MKKIPTLFVREYGDHKVIGIKPKLTSPDLQWVLDGDGIATVKWDGSCCAIIDGLFYKRFDAKAGRKIPKDAIPCCDPDPITGHWPHWVPMSISDASSKWYIAAFINFTEFRTDGTYEAVGPHFNGNPYGFEEDILIPHGKHLIDELNKKLLAETPHERSFEQIREFLKEHEIEGIVFWKDGEPQCKIKRSDFGFAWPV